LRWRVELEVHEQDCPSDGIEITIIPDGDSREFRTSADAATIARPGYLECVAMMRTSDPPHQAKGR
jgi:hypothetical protein